MPTKDDYIATLQSENERLRAELAECRKDAERYRWLRDRADSVIDWDFMPPCSHEFFPLENGCASTLDHVIDAAINQARGEPFDPLKHEQTK